MPRGETSNVADGLENVVAAGTVLSKVDGDAGVLILRGHYLQDIAGKRSFEWLTGLLWQDFVDRALDEASLRRDLGVARELAFQRIRDLLPAAGACHHWRRSDCCWRACPTMPMTRSCC